MSDRSSRADVNGVKRSSRQPGPASSAISSRIPTGIRRWGAVGSIILASTAGATAQQSSTPGRSAGEFDPQEVVRIDLQAVEESIGDQGALDQSLRWVPSGLQLPAGYAQVYARSGGGFFRADGGLVATFDRSIYVPTQYGPMPDIPASTLFVIGGVGAEAAFEAASRPGLVAHAKDVQRHRVEAVAHVHRLGRQWRVMR